MPAETHLAAILCSLLLNGEAEVRHTYTVAGDQRHIRVDCETPTHVYEVGFDGKRSSFDSLHQAIFAAHLTGKLPAIVIIDTDGQVEPVEYQVRTVAQATGVCFLSTDKDFLIRWQMTAPFRQDQRAPLFGY